MTDEKVFAMSFGKVYPLLVNKAVRKGRTADEVDTIICWLTGYDPETLHLIIERGDSYRAFFDHAPCLNPNVGLITGRICGIVIENIEDPLLKTIRRLDKLVDELAKGRSLDKIMRKSVE